MSRSTRAFVGSSLAALVGAAGLHGRFLAGSNAVWTAAVYLMLFGWITGIICAVSYHTMPVFSGRDFPRPGLIWLHWAAFTAGVVVATPALIMFWRPGIVGGLLLQGTAALVFVANTVLLFRSRWRRAQQPVPPALVGQREVDLVGRRATQVSALSLPVAFGLLAVVWSGRLGAGWLLAAEHLAALGWIMLMIMGVGVHVLPRFSGAAVRGAGWARAALYIHLLALALMVSALGFGWSRIFAATGVLMAVAVGLFAWTIWPALQVVRPRVAPIRLSFKERPR